MTTILRRSTRFSFTLLALLIFVQLAHAERRERLIDAWQPLDYDITLVLNDQLSEITKASAALNINILKGPLSLVDLDFGEMTVDVVKVNSQDARFEQRVGKLLVTLPNAAKAGERLMVVVQYHGRPKDGLIMTKDKTGKPSATGDNWPDRVHHWIPCLDHPSAKATVRFTVTAPQRTLVVANGQLTSKRDNEGGTRTWIYTEKKPIPPYCMVIAVGEFALLEPERRASTPLQYYVPQVDRDYAVKGFSSAPFAVDFFSSTVAPFPYDKLALIVSSTRFGGMENSGAIVFPGTLFDNRPTTNLSRRFGIRRGLEEVTAHEIAHQWFGDSVTEATWADLWLSEGFATYFAGLFIEEFDGHADFREYMKRQADTYFQFERERRIPMHDTETTELFALLNGNNYQKGAWVLHMLRGLLGDKAFFRGIRDFYEAHKEKTATSEDLRRALERASGQDLKEFFTRWIYGSGHPRYEATWDWREPATRGAGTLYITLRQTQSDEPFLMPLTVEFTMQGATARRETLKPTGKETTARFDLPHRPSSVRLDPDDFILKELLLKEAPRSKKG